MTEFRAALIVVFDEQHHELLKKFIADIGHEDLFIEPRFARRKVSVNVRRNELGFDVDKSLFANQPVRDVLFLTLDMGKKVKSLNECIDKAFQILQYDNHQQLFDLRCSNAFLRVCLYAETEDDVFDITLSKKSLDTLSKMDTDLDIDIYHYLT